MRNIASYKYFLCAGKPFFLLSVGETWCGTNCGDRLLVSMRLSSPPDCWTFLWTVLLFNAMGCIQSIRCKPKSFRDSIVILELNATIDSNPTSIDETSGVVLRYRTPHFRANARILVPPVAAKETWTIGWIQACNHMEFFNTYGDKGMWVSSGLVVAWSGVRDDSALNACGWEYEKKQKSPLTSFQLMNKYVIWVSLQVAFFAIDTFGQYWLFYF